MTVISTLITKHWTVHATDSLITVRQEDQSYEIKEQERTKIVRVGAFSGAVSYWGLAWDPCGSWNTLEWLSKQSELAYNWDTPADFASHLAQKLTEEIGRLRALPSSDRGLGLHFTAYEYVDGLHIPELFLIQNFADASYNAYSGDCDRLFRSKMTAHSGGSALGGFLTPIGHVASTLLSFPGSWIDRVSRGNP